MATNLIALDARLRLTPRLGPDSQGSMALHIVAVTVISVLFVAVGVGIRL